MAVCVGLNAAQKLQVGHESASGKAAGISHWMMMIIIEYALGRGGEEA